MTEETSKKLEREYGKDRVLALTQVLGQNGATDYLGVGFGSFRRALKGWTGDEDFGLGKGLGGSGGDDRRNLFRLAMEEICQWIIDVYIPLKGAYEEEKKLNEHLAREIEWMRNTEEKGLVEGVTDLKLLLQSAR